MATGNQNQSMTKFFLFGAPFILLLLVNSSFAAPANSNEDQVGYAASSSGQGFRGRETNPSAIEYNLVPLVSEPAGLPLETSLGIQQQPIDFGLVLNYLLARHSGMNNRALFYPDLGSRNELGRKRSMSNSRSRYCAFNAVSCFGRKK